MRVSRLLPSYSLFIGLRYSFSRKRNRFTAIIAMVSMLGMVLGVASLITVLSVMNGFAGELRGRILSLVPHGYVEAISGEGISDWESLAQTVTKRGEIEAASPYISEKVILGGSRLLRGAVLTGIDPALLNVGDSTTRTLTLTARGLQGSQLPPLSSVQGAVNIPLGDLEQSLCRIDAERPVVVFCRSGGRSTKAAELLTGNGYADVTNLAGGMLALEN